MEGKSFPCVSIIIPVFNHFDQTARCLLSLSQLRTAIDFEIIVVDDGSSDDTEAILKELYGIRYIRNDTNSGFIDSCNKGATQARGEYILLLNNDTFVLPGWLDALTDTFIQHKDCGLAGSMLVYPHRTMQEAGGCIFRDASGCNWGRGKTLRDPVYNYLREVDYCSGASIMIRSQLFKQLGGLDTRFRPAYYEDTDLAFAVREAGLKVYYQPASKVIHYEGVTSGKDITRGMKAFQARNQSVFKEKWANVLTKQPENLGVGQIPTHGRRLGRILVLDATTPTPDKDSGSLDMFNALRIMVRLGYHVDYIPTKRPFHLGRYTEDLQKAGVCCYHKPYFTNLEAFLSTRPDIYDLVFISRLVTMKSCHEIVKKLAPKAKVIFNTVDLHFLREIRRAKVESDLQLQEQAQLMRKLEIGYMRSSDASIIISPAELMELGGEVDSDKLVLVPLIREFPSVQSTYENSEDIAFIANFQHPPNVDAMRFFLADVWPWIHEKLPSVRFLIIGDHFPKASFPDLDDSVVLLGPVPDLDPIFSKLRITVAPLRYGAGLKGKVATSLGYGVPCVLSPIAIEGTGLLPGRDALLADTPSEWIDRVLELYGDQRAWEALAEHGAQVVRREYSMEANTSRFQQLFEHLGLLTGIQTRLDA